LIHETWNANAPFNALVEAMYTRFEKYWTAPSMVLLIVDVLDPSMKVDFLHVTENGNQEKHLIATVGKFSVVWNFQQVKDNKSRITR
jgi:hypothetical protein